MNVNVIKKPLPHCPIPYGHPLFKGYVPAAETNIRRTFSQHHPTQAVDDYTLTDRLGYLETIGAWK